MEHADLPPGVVTRVLQNSDGTWPPRPTTRSDLYVEAVGFSTEPDWLRRGDSYRADLPKPTRNPFKWPYPPESYWNMPIGRDARLTALNMPLIANTQFKFRWEEEILTLDPSAPVQTIEAHNAAWDKTRTRCGSRLGTRLVGNGTVANVDVPVPPGFITDPGGLPNGYLGTTPNHASAHVRRNGDDIELLECQPTHICTDGQIISQSINSWYVGDSIYTGGMGQRGGSHGGSRMSAFGGTIRCHELVPGGRIPHAVKWAANTSKMCFNHDTQAECFTWPAIRADGYALSSYGSTAAANVPREARMGMLVTLPATFDVDALKTEPGRIIARAFYEYGGYLVDGDADLDVFMIAVEWSNEGRVLNDFERHWGIKGFHRGADGTPSQLQKDLWADTDKMYMAFQVVVDNSPSTPGGAGTSRRAALAPPL